MVDLIVKLGVFKKSTIKVKEALSFKNMLAPILNIFHIPFVDDCCPSANENPFPVGATSSSNIQFYNSESQSWENISLAPLTIPKNYVVVPDANYTLLSTDGILNLKDLSTTRTITLTSTGRVFGDIVVIINGTLSDMIFGGFLQPYFDGINQTNTLFAQYVFTIIFDGVDWNILSRENVS